MNRILLYVQNTEWQTSFSEFLRQHLPEYELQRSCNADEIIETLVDRSEPESTVVLIDTQESLSPGSNISAFSLFERLRLEVQYPWSAVKVVFLSSEDRDFFRESMSLNAPILVMDKHYQVLSYKDISLDQFAKTLAASKMLSREEVDQIRRWSREEERTYLSSQFRHHYITPTKRAAARLLQGAFLAGNVEPSKAADILSEFGIDNESSNKLREYIKLMIDKGYVTKAEYNLSDAVSRFLLIDDQYDVNCWESVLGVILRDRETGSTKLHCESTIEDALEYLRKLPHSKTFVLLDLLLRDEEGLTGDDAIEQAIHEGLTNLRRLKEFDMLLPVLVFTKHGANSRINRMIRKVRLDYNRVLLDYYSKEIDESRDELKYYEKFCELISSIQEAADHAIDIKASQALHSKLLGEVPDDIPGFEFGARTVPCRELGGDYYSVYKLGTDRVLIVIADISGKGIEAALLTVLLHTAIRLLVNDHPFSPLIMRLDELVSDEAKGEKHVTAFFAMLDLKSYILTYWNAGHNNPVLTRSNESFTDLEECGRPLGYHRSLGPQVVQERQIQLRSGDILALSTDGITEAEDNKSIQFGEERFKELVDKLRAHSAKEIVEKVLQEVEIFAEAQADDRTVVALKVL